MAFGEIVSNTLQVIAVGVLLGAGLPALFACGIKLLDIGRNPASAGAGDTSADGNGEDGAAGTTGGNRAAQVGGYAIFAAIVVVVLYAILFVVKSSLSHYLGIELPI
jgi:hypothetical protein